VAAYGLSWEFTLRFNLMGLIDTLHPPAAEETRHSADLGEHNKCADC